MYIVELQESKIKIIAFAIYFIVIEMLPESKILEETQQWRFLSSPERHMLQSLIITSQITLDWNDKIQDTK